MWLTDKEVKRNLLLFIYMWCCVSFSYYLVGFQIKYIKGNVYTNIMTSSIADNIGTVASAVLYTKWGVRSAFQISLALTLLGGSAILLLHSFPFWMPLFILLSKMGISSAFNLVFLANADLFPTLFSATAMGICNFFARLTTIAAPQVAERPEPFPMTLYLLLNVGAVLCVRQLRSQTSTKKVQAKEMRDTYI